MYGLASLLSKTLICLNVLHLSELWAGCECWLGQVDVAFQYSNEVS